MIFIKYIFKICKIKLLKIKFAKNKIPSLIFWSMMHNTHFQDKLVIYKGIYISDHNYYKNKFKQSSVPET